MGIIEAVQIVGIISAVAGLMATLIQHIVRAAYRAKVQKNNRTEGGNSSPRSNR